MSPLAAYVLIFLAVGAGFVLVNLLIGKLVRPVKPDAEKGTVYECGEPTIGSAWVQFDLRFYVVALLFVIFDVEVAFFFPWAEVFGKANAVAAAAKPADDDRAGWQAYTALVQPLTPPFPENAEQLKRFAIPAEGFPDDKAAAAARQSRDDAFANNQKSARSLGLIAFVDILVFFGVLLVGFAYLWKRGDLAWVRSLTDRQAAAAKPAPPSPLAATPTERVGAGAGSF
jgi:NADH-quinone oxidoreductase subunit A